MRDPKRINTVIELLRAYWQAQPDLRLGQIVCNLTPDRHRIEVTRDAYTQAWDATMADPFSVEDSEWEEILRTELRRLAKEHS